MLARRERNPRLLLLDSFQIEGRLILLATDAMDTDKFFNPGCDCGDCEEWRHDHGRTKQFLLFASDDKDYLVALTGTHNLEMSKIISYPVICLGL